MLAGFKRMNMDGEDEEDKNRTGIQQFYVTLAFA
jgi:hypothetical protein